MKTKKKSSKTEVVREPLKIVKKVHYYNDTLPIHGTLTMGAWYQTSKGTGKYNGRSRSNGKLTFLDKEGKTLWFTAQEWNVPANTSSKPNDCVMAKKQKESWKSVSEIVANRVKGEKLLDINTGKPINYFHGISPEGILVGIVGRDGFIESISSSDFLSKYKFEEEKKNGKRRKAA